MPKYGQLVMGPAGSGKTTYCSVIKENFEVNSRSCHIVNLDPAAEDELKYQPSVDIRELIKSREVAEELTLGPNGALVACMEYLVDDGFDWFEDQMLSFGDDDYVIFDLPGQIELYSHIPVVRKLVKFLKRLDFRLCGVYCIDCMFITDASKFIAGSLSALSAMINLELPHINVLTKCDLLKERAEFLDMEVSEIKDRLAVGMDPRYKKLNEAMAGLLEEYSLVGFVDLNITDEESVEQVLQQVNNTINYGEDLEPRESDYIEKEEADSCL